MFRDFLCASRQLRKSPLIAGVLILTLALGIGANASMFAAVNSILLHPFPYPNVDRVMTLWETIPKSRLERAGVAPGNFMDFQEQNRSFETLAAFQRWKINIIGADRPEPVEAVRVSPGFFRVFGMKPKSGELLKMKLPVLLF
jgi:putative ABC transport system permease protein